MFVSRPIYLPLLLAALPAFLNAAEDRVRGPVDPGRVVRLRTAVHPAVRPQNDRGPVDPATELPEMSLAIKPAAGLEQLLAEQRDPSSPNYLRWLTPEQFAGQFGLSANDLRDVTAWLTSQGLRVSNVARGQTWIAFRGAAGRVGRAFRTEIRRYEAGGRSHFANATEPSLPAALEAVVESVHGLSDFEAKPHYVARPQYTFGPSHFLAPEDFATIYNLKPLHDAGIDGSGQSVVVIGRTEIDLAAIRSFRRRFGLPPGDPEQVLFGPEPGVVPGDDLEASLDLQWAGATAPGAKIIYAYARSVGTALRNAIDQNLGPVITMSYGGCEQAFDPYWRYVIQQANAQGITVLVSSGDAGAAACDFTSPTPQAAKGSTVGWPASIPEITAVGGTRLNDSGGDYWNPANSTAGGSARSYIPETAWNDSSPTNSLSATAGGPSAWFAKPPWQFGPGVPDDGARDVPDISFSASPQHVSYLVMHGGSTYLVGGTSAASPAFAGVVAMLNQYLLSNGTITQPGLGNINPMLYRLAQTAPEAFHDVTAGHNKVPCAQGSAHCVNGFVGHDAGPGYDLATGLGSADVEKLITSWSTASATKIAIAATPHRPGLDETVQLTATVAATGSGIPAGTVTFATNFGLIGTAPLVAAGGSATATLSARAVLIAGGKGRVTATYSGDRLFDGSSAFLDVSVVLPATGSVVVPVIFQNPVHQVNGAWRYVVALVEKGGVATRLTGLTINGVVNSVANLFPIASIPANGVISAALSPSTLPSVPVNRTFVFTGEDADGTTWTRTLTVPFLAGPGRQVYPAITATATPSTVQQNPLAPPECQWSHQLVIQEQNGFLIQLTRLTASATNLTAQIQELFGTTRLAPLGSLRATVCWDVPMTSRTYQVTGTAENGNPVTAGVTVSFTAASVAPAAFSVGTGSVSLRTSPDSAVATGTVQLNFSAGSPRWSVRAIAANRNSEWLSVSPVSGSGAAELRVQASGGALSPGAYSAVLAIQASDALPQIITVPVTFIVNPAAEMSIAGIGNAFSGATTFAPGALVSVYGTGLSAGTQPARGLPLPLEMQGVSAAVNGVSAPLHYVSPGQLNVQIPYETGLGDAVLAVKNRGQVAAFPIRIAMTAPGLAMNSDRTVTAGGKPGQVLVLYVTGEGDLTPSLATGATPDQSLPLTGLPEPRQPVSAHVAGIPAQIVFAGVPWGLAGVTQINFTVPDSVPPGAHPLVVSVGGVECQPVTLRVLE